MISFITNHIPLRQRIQSVYLMVGAVSLMLAAIGYLGLTETTLQFERFARFSQKTRLGIQLTTQVSEMQRASERFTSDGYQSAAQQVQNSYEDIQQILGAIRAFDDADDRPYIERIGRHLDTYHKSFQDLRAQRDRQSELLGSEIRRHASDAERQVQRYLDAIPATDRERRLRAVRILNDLLRVEKYAYRYFDSLDADQVKRAKASLASTRRAFQALSPAQTPDELRHMADTLQAYEDSFLEAVQRTRGYLYLVNVVMPAEAYEILYQSRHIAELHNREMRDIEQEIVEIVDQVVRTSLLLGGLFILMLMGFSYAIGRSITQPLQRLTRTFNNLSEGAGDTEIPRYRLHDEIGHLCRAAKVFRDKNNETRTLLDQYQELSGELERKVERRTRELAASNRQLLSAKESAEAATRAKSDFLANMSHEIRTPIHAIMGMAYLMRQTALDERQQGHMRHMETSSNALLHLINDILDFSKIEAGKLRLERIEFDLQAVIDNAAALLGMKAEQKGLEFIVHFAAQLPTRYRGDPTRLGQILTNLLGNAIKFTAQGEVGITIGPAHPTGLCFEIWDSGPGISKEDQHKLFQTYAQADTSTTREYGGTGLGLAISRQLAELMGGRIRVSSEPGKGSRFSCEIPLEAIGGREDWPRELDGTQALILEPVAAAAQVTRELCERLGMRVRQAASSTDALNPPNRNEPADLIILSSRVMATAQSQTLAELKQQANNDAPLLILGPSLDSGGGPDERLPKEAQFFPKPLNPEHFRDKLLQLFGKKTPGQPPNPTDTADKRDELSRLRGSRLLLVDDNRLNREIIHGMLGPSGIRIDDAEHGGQAVQMLRDNPDGYALVLMDIQMPVLDGYQATAEIRRMGDKTPIIALTADALVSDMEKTRACGMNEHLNKPIDAERLFDVLLRYLTPKAPAAPTRTGPPPAADFPPMSHVDTATGLRRFMGDAKLYATHLTEFVRLYGDAGERLPALTEQDPEAARHLVHTLKGVSGNLAAKPLYDIAVAMHQAPSETGLKALRNELAALVAEIQGADLMPKEATAPKPPAEPEQQRQWLRELSDALAESRPKRIEPVFERLLAHELDPGLGDLMAELQSLLRGFRYADAKALLDKHIDHPRNGS